MYEKRTIMAFHYLYENSYGLQQNQAFCVCMNEGYTPGMQYFHMHSHYEISFIMSGNVSVLLPDQISSGTEARVILLRPFTLHYIIPEPDQLYRRFNLYFTDKYAEEKTEEWLALHGLFSNNGAVLLPDSSQCRRLEQIFSIMLEETDLDRNRYLLMYTMSLLCGLHQIQNPVPFKIPDYIHQVLLYLSEHYTEKIAANELAQKVGVGRTTLMTGFRKYVGITIHQYQQNLRLKHADILRKQGLSVTEAAEASGYCDIGGYIRAYRKVYGASPTGKE